MSFGEAVNIPESLSVSCSYQLHSGPFVIFGEGGTPKG